MGDIGEEIKQSKFRSEQHKAILNLAFTAGFLEVEHARFLKQYDVSPQQYNVLRILRGQFPKPATVNLIQERMLDKMSNASRLVEKLKQKEFLQRNECPMDRRQVEILISPKGLELLKKVDDAQENIDKRFEKITKEEAEELNRILNKLRD